MITAEEGLKIPQVSVLANTIMLFNDEVYGHCLSVANLSEKLVAEAEGFTEQQKDDVVIGAILHDIGKIFVPFNLTDNARRLTENEFEIVKTHTRIGYEMLRKDFSEIVSNIALYHHERPNGTGYSSSLPLARIPKEALLVQVADIYDALISKRRYKNGYDSKAAIEIMKNDSKNFKIDDEYLEILLSILKREEKI